MLTTEQMQTLWEWQHLSQQIKEIAPREMELRKQVAAMLVPENTKGTHRFPLVDTGYEAKIVLGESVQLDKGIGDILPTVYQQLIAGGLTEDEAGSLIKTEMKLNIGAYNKLSANMQKIMAAVVTTKPSAPTIEIAPIKEKK